MTLREAFEAGKLFHCTRPNTLDYGGLLVADSAEEAGREFAALFPGSPRRVRVERVLRTGLSGCDMTELVGDYLPAADAPWEPAAVVSLRWKA